ncbi:MAG TPA: Abi family protein [Stenotrophomonas sp.]|nr:Abi family protein [Stenotrophomonas sp.]
MRYSKQPLSFADQLQLMQDRGLIVRDPARALRWLKNVSYYRLSAYFLPFKRDEAFIPGTEFDDIAGLYIFDRKLRLLVLDAIERVEVAIRTAVAYEISRIGGAFGHVNPANFAPQYRHADLLRDIRTEEVRAGETFVQHFRNKYTSEPDLPVWMATELLSFGTISLMYRFMPPASKSAIARPYGVPDAFFARWLHSLSYVRNVCAHHKRLWNREFAIRPPLPTRTRTVAWGPTIPHAGRIYCALAILRHLLLVVSPGCHWKARLEGLLAQHPHVCRQAMGFDPDWQSRTLWR